jgi:hypothetical protein
MVMEDMKTPRETHLLVRGAYDKPGEKVLPGVPANLPALPQCDKTNRLAFARWLVDPSNPLTARVAVNRYWQMFFGTGLVKTGEDFGVRQDVIDEVFAEEGIRSSAESALSLVDDGADAAHGRLKHAFAQHVDGVGLGELVGGYGVAETALAALEFRGIAPVGATAVVQGFGSMGGATARYLNRAGVRVVGIADREGLEWEQGTFTWRKSEDGKAVDYKSMAIALLHHHYKEPEAREAVLADYTKVKLGTRRIRIIHDDLRSGGTAEQEEAA